MKQHAVLRLIALTFFCASVSGWAAGRAGNLLVNGSFDNEDDPLTGWRYKYDLKGETQWYGENHTHVSVIPRDGIKKNVLRLHGDKQIFFDVGQGVKVDSMPVPYDPKSRYKLKISVRSDADSPSMPGPNCRIYIEGYGWKPGVKPYENPQFYDLRRCYKGAVMQLPGTKGSKMSGTKKSWVTGTTEFPTKKASELSLKHLKKVKFISVHVIAIMGADGALLVDDVELTKTR